MFELTRRMRIGLVAVTALAASATGLLATQAQTPTAEAAQCYERFVGAPINEKGIQCPGDPAIWKSYTFASSGFGYYTETEQLANGISEVRLGYKHQDGRIAISIMECGSGGNGCQETYWNGIPFPFGH
ncbi:MAG: hypothetical protein AB7K36_06445 [Chloroflexota bacterium]